MLAVGFIVSTGALFALPNGATGRTLTVLYTNDLHLRLARLESMAALIEAERASGTPVLLVDAGDAWHDFRRPLTAVWGADAMVDWMNRVGYDAMALGNHDLYWMSDRLFELSDRARFPLLCANLEPTAEVATPFARSVVLTLDGIRALLLGVVTSEHLPYPDYPWLRYLDPAEAIAREIDASDDPVDLVVAIGHVPVDRAVRIVEAVPTIDLFVSGHSHEVTIEPVRVGESLVVQTGAFGQRLGRLVLDVDRADEGRIAASEFLETERAPTAFDRGLFQFLAVASCLIATVLVVVR